MTRRELLRRAAAVPAAAVLPAQTPAPVRAITRGPKYHWFGYYDKLQFDPSSRYALGVQGSFEHRLPTADDRLRIGMVDLHDQDRWIDLGETSAWSWHQTCMLQWLPGSDTDVIYNDREGDRFVSRILNVRTGKQRTLPLPVYCVSPDSRWGIVNDFRRSSYMRPETGYAGLADPDKNSPAPERSGIWRMDLATGKHELIVSLAQVVAIPHREPYSRGSIHYFDHLLFAPDGQRFAFFQRWRGEAEGRGFSTRMLTANRDGGDIRVLDPYGKTSHYIWRDPRTILVWMHHPSHASRFYLVDEPTGRVEVFAPEAMPVNGHASYLPGNRYIVNDTYPDEQRLQHTYLYDTRTGRRHALGGFHSPPEYAGAWRCDTTPRCSPDGRKIVIDSPHGGNGRQMYLIDVSGVVG